MKVVLPFILMFISFAGFGQFDPSHPIKLDKDKSNDTNSVQPDVLAKVDNSFLMEIMEYCSKNYPEVDKKNLVEGRLFVQFVVEKDGSISNVAMKKGLTETLNEVAINSVKKAGEIHTFTPAKIADRNVRSMMIVPIKFSLGLTEKQKKKLLKKKNKVK